MAEHNRVERSPAEPPRPEGETPGLTPELHQQREMADRLETDYVPQAGDEVPAGHETRDINVRALGIFAVALVAVILIALVGIGFYYSLLAQRPVPAGQINVPVVEVEPQPVQAPLIIVPGQEQTEWRAVEDAVLSSYDWVDRENGIARIPITRAMELAVDQGFPVQENAVTPEFGRYPAYQLDSAGGQKLPPESEIEMEGGDAENP